LADNRVATSSLKDKMPAAGGQKKQNLHVYLRGQHWKREAQREWIVKGKKPPVSSLRPPLIRCRPCTVENEKGGEGKKRVGRFR